MIERHFQWIPPPPPKKEIEAEEKIAVDLGDEYEHALSSATQEEIIDLAGENEFLYKCITIYYVIY